MQIVQFSLHFAYHKGFEEVKKWTETNPGAKCVVSYSMSSKGISPSLDAAVKALSEKCVIVISAGNYGQDPETADACLYSPGRREEVRKICGSDI